MNPEVFRQARALTNPWERLSANTLVFGHHHFVSRAGFKLAELDAMLDLSRYKHPGAINEVFFLLKQYDCTIC